MRKLLKTIVGLLTSLIVLSIGAACAEAAWDGTSATGFYMGTGTQSMPYVIKTEQHLAYFADQLNSGNTFEGQYLSLTADLDMTGGEWNVTAGQEFSGTFRGNNHTIIINNRFLATIAAEGTVDWLNLSATETLPDALLCKYNYGTIQNCRVRGDVYVDPGDAGLLCTTNYSTGRVINSCGFGSVYGCGDDNSCYVGWVARNYGAIQNCYAVVSLSGSAPGKYNDLYTGAITASGSFENCYADSEVFANDDAFVAQLNQTLSVPGYIWVVDKTDANEGYPVIDDCLTAATQLAESSAPMFAFYGDSLDASIGCTESGCTIYYTLDGSNPTISNTRKTYNGSITLSKDTIVTTVAYKNGEYGTPNTQYAIQLLGAGTDADPYQISSHLDLYAIRFAPDKVYALTDDLDFTNATYVHNGILADDWVSIPTFSGTLNGERHSIIGLSSATGGLVNSNSGTIRELRLLDHQLCRKGVDYNDYYAHFGPVANSNSGTITRCYAAPDPSVIKYTDVMYNGVGGIVGSNSGTISYCSSSGKIKVDAYESYSRPNLAGIAGQNSGTVQSCYSDAEIYMCYTNHDMGATVGGITYGGRVYDCRFDGYCEIDSYTASFGVGAAANHGNSSESYRCYNGGATFYHKTTSGHTYYTQENDLYKTTSSGLDFVEANFSKFDFNSVWMITEDGPMPQGIMQEDGNYYTKKSYTAPNMSPGETVCYVNDTSDTVIYTLPASGLISSGTHGDNLVWILDANGTLTIRGTGEMADYSCAWLDDSASINRIVIEDGITSIGAEAFKDCGSATDISIPNSVTSIGAGAFMHCSEMSSIIIPTPVTSIGNGAFSYCGALTDLIIPPSVTSIGSEAFEGCSQLSDITFEGNAPSFGTDPFSSVTATVYYPGGDDTWNDVAGKNYGGTLTWISTAPVIASGTCGAQGRNLRWALDDTGTLTISGAGAMANYANTYEPWYSYRTSIKSVIIKNGVTSIGHNAFEDYSRLTSVTIPDSVISIGTSAFYYCEALTDITIPESVTSIGNTAFQYCRKLATVTFEGSAPSLGSSAFGYVTATVYYPGGDDSWDDAANQNYGGTLTWKVLCAEHTEVVLPAVKATCTESGLTEGVHCSACGVILVEQEETSVLGHSYTNYTPNDDATCQKNRTETASCNNGCGTTSTRTIENSTVDHSFSNYVSNNDAVCGTDGSETAACDFGCGTTDTRTVTGSAKEHSYSTYVSNNDATCQKNGTETAVCDNGCGTTDTRTIENSTVDHKFSNYTFNNDATCERDGSETANCDFNCGTIDTRTIVGSRTEHEWVSTDDPFTQECQACGATKNAGISGICGAQGDNLTWTLTDDGTLTISGSGAMRDYYFDDYAPWYSYKDNIKKVQIESGVTLIGEFAFHWCSKITEITLPDTLKTIGAWAHSHCSALKSIDFPEGLLEINGEAFYACSSLASVFIPSTVNKIDGAFGSCDSLEEIKVHSQNQKYSSLDGVLFNKDKTILLEYPAGKPDKTYSIPAGVTSANSSAFWHSNFETVSIPTSMSEVNQFHFNHCDNLESITVSTTNPNYCAIDGVLFTADLSTLVRYPAAKAGVTYTIPETVTTIGAYSFDSCQKLVEIILPTGLSTIEYDAFYDCSALANIVLPNTLTSIESGAFSACSSLKGIILPPNLTAVEDFMFSNCDALETVVIPSGVTTIGHYAFKYCDQLSIIHRCSNTKLTLDEGNEYFEAAQHHYLTQTAYASEATCTKIGQTDGFFCSICNQTIISATETPALGHDLVYHEAQAATCTNIGWTAYETCSRCSHSTYSEIPVQQHNFVVYTSNNDATCTKDGTETASCDFGCGDSDTRTVVGSAKGHSYTGYTPNHDATCQKNGTETALCDNGCGTTSTRTIPDSTVAHLFSNYISNNDASCETDGSETAQCSYGCGNSDTRTAVGSLKGHSFTNYESNNDATCQKNETETASCDNGCGESNTRTIENSTVDHKFSSYVSNNDATCETDATETASCDFGCGTTDTRTVTGSALSHSFTSYESNHDATCQKNETETASCDHGCGTSNTRTIANSTVDHQFNVYISNDDATCQTNTTETATCNFGCGASDTREIANSTVSHSYTNYTSDGNATCQADGTETAQCDFECGTSDTRTEEGSKTTHSYTAYTPDGNATCQEDGTKTAQCDYACGTSRTVSDTGSKTDHRFTNYTPNHDATCQKNGTETALCDYGCGSKETRTIPNSTVSHKYTTYASNGDATCNTDGTETAWCDYNCGTSDTRADTGSQLSHSYTNYHPNSDATCQKNETETAFCDHGCGESNIRVIENSTVDHSYTNYGSDGNATCTADGSETALCDYGCGTTDTRPDSGSKVNHSYTEYVSDGNATCTKDGTKTAYCDYNCGASETLPDSGSKRSHSFTNYVSNQDATCEKNSTATAQCDFNCGASDTHEIANSTVNHKYTNYIFNDDATCSKDGTETAYCDYVCGNSDTRTKIGSQLTHHYVSGICEYCGEAEEIVPFKFVVSQAKGRAGDTVEVKIDMAENPGIIAACMSLSYDAEKLTLIAATDAGLLKDRTFSQSLTANPYLMRWEESLAITNNTANGTIVTLKFKIAENCSLETIPLTLELSESEIYNADVETVRASAVSGSVEVVQYLSGDANSDGNVNSVDVTLLRRFLAAWPNISINEAAMDVNDDSLVNSPDVTILRRYLAGWPNISLLSLIDANDAKASLYQEGPMQFIVSDVSGSPGEEVEVTVSIGNNPGIVAACMSLTYDADCLELLSVADNRLLNDGMFSPTTDSNPYAMRWEDSLATSNNTENGVIATLKFRILEECELGESALTLAFRPGEVYDVELNPVPFEIDNGKITIAEQEEPRIVASYDATTGIVRIQDLPNEVASVFAAVNVGNQMIACGSGMSEIQLSTEDVQKGNAIKVFYLNDQYQPCAKPSYIWIK